MGIHVYPNWQTNFDSKKNSGKKSFSYETKVSMSSIPIRKNVSGAQSWKKMRSLHVSLFYPIDRWALILRKMVERKAFLTKPKYQCHLS